MTESEYQLLLYTNVLLNLMQIKLNDLISEMNEVESQTKKLLAMVQSLKEG